jgi:hypothetical protein
MESGRDQNYWPGFVDALSNVVLTLVFVLVVFVFGLMLASSKMGQKTKEVIELARAREQQRTTAEAETADLRRELREALKHLQELKDENEALRRQMAEMKKTQVPGSEELNLLKEKVAIKVDAAPKTATDLGEADLEAGTGVILLVFPRGVFELTDKVRAELDRAVAGVRPGLRVTLRSYPGAETYSEGRRLAFYRGMTVRNYLIDKQLGNGRTINITIEQDKEVGDGRVEIRFHSR